MRSNYDQLKVLEKISVFGILLAIMSRYYIYGGMQQLDYYHFSLNEDKYQVVEAQIVDMNEYPITLRGYGTPFFIITKIQVYYKIEEDIYLRNIYTYEDKKECKTIPIAVDKKNSRRIRRCIPYTKLKNNFIKNTLNAGEALGKIIIIFTILKLFIVYRRKSADRKALQKIDEEKEREFEKNRIKNREKQNRILSFCSYERTEIIDEAIIANTMKKLEISYNEDFLWCLEHLAKAERIKSILLLDVDEKGEYSFVAETIKLREQKLPKEFYIIAKTENNFLCGTAESSRVYSFSNALGVTNTQYASVYDYIIEQMDKE